MDLEYRPDLREIIINFWTESNPMECCSVPGVLHLSYVCLLVGLDGTDIDPCTVLQCQNPETPLTGIRRCFLRGIPSSLMFVHNCSSPRKFISRKSFLTGYRPDLVQAHINIDLGRYSSAAWF